MIITYRFLYTQIHEILNSCKKHITQMKLLFKQLLIIESKVSLFLISPVYEFFMLYAHLLTYIKNSSGRKCITLLKCHHRQFVPLGRIMANSFEHICTAHYL